MAKVLETFLVFRKEDVDDSTFWIDPSLCGAYSVDDDSYLRNCYDMAVFRKGVCYVKYRVFCDLLSTASKVLSELYPNSTVLGGFCLRAPLPDATPVHSGEIRERFWGLRPPRITVDTHPL